MIQVNQRFGMLTTLSNQGPIKAPKNRKHFWLCRCDCGKQTTVESYKLTSDSTKSCGCLKSTKARAQMTTHGMADSAEYKVWKGIKRRCYNPHEKCYPHYGGRGIKMCDAWRESFDAFYADMGPRPAPRLQIDRKDNHGDYTPENCRWATVKENANNRRGNVSIEHNGETLSASEWAARIGIKSGTLRKRLRDGWPLADALSPGLKTSRWWK